MRCRICLARRRRRKWCGATGCGSRSMSRIVAPVKDPFGGLDQSEITHNRAGQKDKEQRRRRDETEPAADRRKGQSDSERDDAERDTNQEQVRSAAEERAARADRKHDEYMGRQ